MRARGLPLYLSVMERTTLVNGSVQSELPSQYMIDDYPAQKFIISIIIILIAVVGVVGNALLIAAVCVCSQLRSATNAFVTSLAVCNFLTCATSPYHASTILRDDPPRPGGCLFIAVVVISTQIISIFTLDLIAVNRLILVRGNITTYDKVFKRRNFIMMILLSWLLPVVGVVLASVFDFATLGYNNKYKICIVESSRSEQSSMFVGIAIGVPSVVIITASYLAIYLFVRRHHKELKKALVLQSRSKNVPTPNSETGNGHQGAKTKPNSDKNDSEDKGSPPDTRQGVSVVRTNSQTRRAISIRQHKLTRNLFVIVCIFLACLFPFVIAIILPDANAVIPWFAVLLFLNSAINPIIHSVFHPQVHELFAKHFCRIVSNVTDRSSVVNSSHI